GRLDHLGSKIRRQRPAPAEELVPGSLYDSPCVSARADRPLPGRAIATACVSGRQNARGLLDESGSAAYNFARFDLLGVVSLLLAFPGIGCSPRPACGFALRTVRQPILDRASMKAGENGSIVLLLRLYLGSGAFRGGVGRADKLPLWVHSVDADERVDGTHRVGVRQRMWVAPTLPEMTMTR